MSAFLFDRLHVGLGQVLDLRQSQHALTASNLANSDTPAYKAQYIPFDEVLEAAVGRGEQVDMRRTRGRHVSAPGADASNPEIREIEPPPWAVDGNSVDPERESVRITENSLLYDAVARGLSRRMALLRYAASDGKAS
jgi:flagellar basal-body rod protein FlgB